MIHHQNILYSENPKQASRMTIAVHTCFLVVFLSLLSVIFFSATVFPDSVSQILLFLLTSSTEGTSGSLETVRQLAKYTLMVIPGKLKLFCSFKDLDIF